MHLLVCQEKRTNNKSGLLNTYVAATEIKAEVGKEEDYAWLAETEPNIYMREGNYTGPTIQV